MPDDVKIYNYYFFGIKKPISIQATSLNFARQCFNENRNNLPEPYLNGTVIGETVSRPMIGITETYRGNKKFIWVGFDRSKDGWQSEESLLKEIDNEEKKAKVIKI